MPSLEKKFEKLYIKCLLNSPPIDSLHVGLKDLVIDSCRNPKTLPEEKLYKNFEKLKDIGRQLVEENAIEDVSFEIYGKNGIHLFIINVTEEGEQHIYPFMVRTKNGSD